MKRTPFFAMITILVAAFAIRVIALAAQPLSGDEAFTVTQWGPATIAHLLDTATKNGIARIDPQPPVALLSYHAWIQLAGSSEFAVRFLSASSSLILVAAAYAIAKSILPGRVPLIAAALCAVAPFQIWYAQDARPYAEWMGLSLLTTAALIHALPSKRFFPWLFYVILAALSLQTFYLDLFSFGASALFVILYFYHAKRISVAWIISQVAIVTLYLPWLLYSKPQNSAYQPTAGFPDIPATLTELVFNNTLPVPFSAQLLTSTSTTLLQLLVTLTAVYAIFAITRSKLRFQKYLITLQVILPIFLLTALSLVTHKAFFRTRYVASASAPLLILISTVPLTQPLRRYRQLAVYGLFLGIIPLCLASYFSYRVDPQFAKAPPWREIAKLLDQNALPGDIVIQNYPDPALPYYYHGPAQIVILPSGENPPPAATITQLQRLPSSYEHLWFIRVDTPFWDKQQVVATWLQANTAYLADTWVGSMRVYQYADWEITPAQIHSPLNIDLGIATLAGYRLTTDPPYPAQPQHLTLELFWHPQRRTITDLHVFVHVITRNPDGTIKLWGQDDHPPQSGRLSTSSWPTAGTIYRDVYQVTLPPNIPDGSYQIIVGLYDPITMQRYPIPTSLSQPEPNGILITTITLPIHN